MFPLIYRGVDDPDRIKAGLGGHDTPISHFTAMVHANSDKVIIFVFVSLFLLKFKIDIIILDFYNNGMLNFRSDVDMSKKPVNIVGLMHVIIKKLEIESSMVYHSQLMRY